MQPEKMGNGRQRSAGSGAVSFSVITPTLNRANHLLRALNSVDAQTVAPLEHIVVDGGSTDGTLDLLAGRPLVTVISEPDDGLYDAINKGIRASSGDVIVLLNDDDTLLPNALEVASHAFTDEPEADMFCGQMIVGEVDSTDNDVLFGSPLLQRLNPRGQAAPILFNARFFRRGLFDRIGLFEPSYRILADTEFLARCYLGNVSVVARQVPVYRYGLHPDSLTYHGGLAAESTILERLRIVRDQLASATDASQRRYWMRWLWWWTFYRWFRWQPQGSLRDLGRLVIRDPLGAVDFLTQLGWHIKTRRERHGRPLDEFREQGSDALSL